MKTINQLTAEQKVAMVLAYLIIMIFKTVKKILFVATIVFFFLLPFLCIFVFPTIPYFSK